MLKELGSEQAKSHWLPKILDREWDGDWADKNATIDGIGLDHGVRGGVDQSARGANNLKLLGCLIWKRTNKSKWVGEPD